MTILIHKLIYIRIFFYISLTKNIVFITSYLSLKVYTYSSLWHIFVMSVLKSPIFRSQVLSQKNITLLKLQNTIQSIIIIAFILLEICLLRNEQRKCCFVHPIPERRSMRIIVIKNIKSIFKDSCIMSNNLLRNDYLFWKEWHHSFVVPTNMAYTSHCLMHLHPLEAQIHGIKTMLRMKERKKNGRHGNHALLMSKKRLPTIIPLPLIKFVSIL